MRYLVLIYLLLCIFTSCVLMVGGSGNQTNILDRKSQDTQVSETDNIRTGVGVAGKAETDVYKHILMGDRENLDTVRIKIDPKNIHPEDTIKLKK